MDQSKQIYLDNAATTQIDRQVIEKMKFSLEEYGNPNSSHELGKRAKEIVEEARVNVALMINAEPSEIIFTSGGTESNNWAIYSSILKTKKKGVATSKIEHHSILYGIQEFHKSIGAKGRFIPVNSIGIVDFQYLKDNINTDLGLVTVMMVNNEIGSIQPIKELSSLAHKYGVLFHTDAVQASGKIPIDVKDLDVDMLSLSGHKFHGPKGVGILYVKDGIDVRPMIAGGHQENGYRAGTYNVPGIVGMGEAARLLNSEDDMNKIRLIDDLLWSLIKVSIPNVKRNGDPYQSVPGVINVCFEGTESKMLVLELSKRGVYCSSGSACNEGQTSPSHVLKAMGCSTFEAHSSVRFSLSRNITKADIYEAIGIISDVVKNNRECI